MVASLAGAEEPSAARYSSENCGRVKAHEVPTDSRINATEIIENTCMRKKKNREINNKIVLITEPWAYFCLRVHVILNLGGCLVLWMRLRDVVLGADKNTSVTLYSISYNNMKHYTSPQVNVRLKFWPYVIDILHLISVVFRRKN